MRDTLMFTPSETVSIQNPQIESTFIEELGTDEASLEIIKDNHLGFFVSIWNFVKTCVKTTLGFLWKLFSYIIFPT